MKKQALKILLLSSVLLLSSCRLIELSNKEPYIPNSNSEQESESLNSETEDESNFELEDDSESIESYYSEEESESEESESEESESLSEFEEESESEESISESEEEILEHILLNKNNFSSSSQYSTGNYSMVNNSGISFNCYRTVGNIGSTMLKIYGAYYPYVDHGLAGTFSNYTPIKGLKAMEITYNSTDDFNLIVFANYNDEIKTYSVSCVDTSVSFTFDSEMAYFAIEVPTGYAEIISIDIGYTDTQTITYNYLKTYQGTRVNPSRYEGSLVSGSSKMSMLDSDGNNKEYVYYSLDYVETYSSTLDMDKVTYIDPVDVSNYYLAFREFPVNYVSKSSVNSYKSLFGNRIRVCQTYSRTDGYATSVPYNAYGGKPLYHELDIDINGTYQTSSRGVGRIVIWEYGFSCYSTYSDGIPIILYTDDHYATFQEYTNKGEFAPRFNGEMKVVHSNYQALSY